MNQTRTRWPAVIFLLPFLALGNPGGEGGTVKQIAPPAPMVLPEKAPDAVQPVVSHPRTFKDAVWDLVESIAFENGLSPKLVKSIILAESNGDTHKVSPRGARGLMQLMPVITREYKVSDPHDPGDNVRGGVQYLKNLLEEFSGDLALALAAYNAGPGTVRKYKGIPPFPETQEFVRKVTRIFHAERAPET